MSRHRQTGWRAVILRLATLTLLTGLTIGLSGTAVPLLEHAGNAIRRWIQPRDTGGEQPWMAADRVGHADEALRASQTLTGMRTGPAMQLGGPGAAYAPHVPLAIVKPRATGNPPQPLDRPFYLRVQTLDTFTAEGWIRSPEITGEAASAHAADRPDTVIPAFHYTVYMRTLTSGVLPVLAMPTSVQAEGAILTADGVVILSTVPRAPLISYQAVSRPLYWDDIESSDVTPASALSYRYLRLPGMPLADQIDAYMQSGPTGTGSAAKRLTALRDRLRTERTYRDTSGEATAHTLLTAFLDDAGGGDCRMFATALALLARRIGFPARVATGYCGGIYVESDGILIFHASEYHAWVEVATREYGWVPIDATPATVHMPPYPPRQAEDGPLLDVRAFPDISDVLRWEAAVHEPAITGSRRLRVTPALLFLVTGGLLLVFSGGTLLMANRVSRPESGLYRRTRTAHLPRFLRHFFKIMAAQGHPIRKGQTLREYVTQLEQQGRAAPEADALTRYVYAIRYAGQPRSRAYERWLSKRLP